MTILLDTNVLGRLANPADPLHTCALNALSNVKEKGYRPAIVPQIIYEFWVIATRPTAQNGLGMSVAEVEADLVKCFEMFDVFRDERAILDHWHSIVLAHDVVGKLAHDARIVAAMRRHNIRFLLTFNDRDFSRFDEILSVNPQSIDSLTAITEQTRP